MSDWSGWPGERLIVFFLGIAFVVVWAQLTLFHWRGAFRSKSMWGPVIFTPIMVVAALLFGAVRNDLTTAVFTIVFAIGVLEGLIGAVLHLRGVAALVGGLNLRNFAAGPPVLLAVAYTALAALGLIARYWPDIAGGAAR